MALGREALEAFLLQNNCAMKKFYKHAWKKESGQAIAEFTISLIAITVLFLGILLFGDLCRARLLTIVDSRKDAGSEALYGVMVGNPTYYGTVDSVEDLKTEVLDATSDPINYKLFKAPVYNYMKQNLVAPLYDSSSPTIDAMHFTKVEKTMTITNYQGLVRLKVGKTYIPITQQTTLPVLEKFE